MVRKKKNNTPPVENKETSEELSEEDIYGNQVKFGMSGVAVSAINEAATESDGEDPDELDDEEDFLSLREGPDGHAPELEALGNENASDAERDIRTSEAPFTGEENLGEQDALGGTEPAPESGSEDAGAWMERTWGRDPDPDMDDPQEVSTDKLDEDEQKILDS